MTLKSFGLPSRITRTFTLLSGSTSRNMRTTSRATFLHRGAVHRDDDVALANARILGRPAGAHVAHFRATAGICWIELNADDRAAPTTGPSVVEALHGLTRDFRRECGHLRRGSLQSFLRVLQSRFALPLALRFPLRLGVRRRRCRRHCGRGHRRVLPLDLFGRYRGCRACSQAGREQQHDTGPGEA